MYIFTSFPLQHLSSRHSPSAATSNTNSWISSPCTSSDFSKSHVIKSSSSVPRFAYHAVVGNNMPTVFELWHRKLGHASKKVVSSILNLCKIPFTSKIIVDHVKLVALLRLIAFPLPYPPILTPLPLNLSIPTCGDPPLLIPLMVINFTLHSLMLTRGLHGFIS